ncbi:unnamed protein product [Ilex paraguariensis]|uniref:E3 ubiquitin-protein ligase PRT1 n=1 Tax=Ilex paraguariensis TaxID=185542 RepID=A0ABC8S3X0_9AQUA
MSFCFIFNVPEEEKKSGSFSPQFDDYLSASSFGTELDNKDASSPHSTTSLHERWHLEYGSCEGKTSLIKSSSEINRPDKENTTTTSSYQAMGDVVGQEISMPGDKIAHGTCQRVFITDLLCALCKQLLCRPVVLNCGHVYCEACIINPGNKACSCHLCPSVHPNGFPNVCLVLKHFLEEQFPEEYASRKETVLTMTDCQQGSPSTCSVRAQQEAATHESLPRNIYSSWWSGQGPKVHPGVGCDYCGMCPIIGERYKCMDCLEKIGFDLCEGCYNSSSKLPGRFNQQHKPDHKFVVVQPNLEGTLILLGPEHSEEDGSNDSEDQEDVSPAPNSSDDAPRDLEEGAAPHIPSCNTLEEDQEGTDSML